MKKINWISGIKGICAIIVLLRHFANAFLPALHTGNIADTKFFWRGFSIENIVNNSPLYLLINGGYVVYIFWLISAFLLSFYYFSYENDNLQMAKKAIKRYVGLLFIILVTYLMAYFLMKGNFFYNIYAGKVSNSEWFCGFYNWNPSFLQVLQSLFLDTFLTANVPFNPVLWTLKVEFLGTLLEIFLLIMFSKLKNMKAIICIVAIFLIYAFPLPYLCFVIGIILGKAYKTIKRNKKRKYNLIGCILLIVSIYGGGYPSDFDPEGKIYGWIPTHIYIWDTRTLIYIFSGSFFLIGVMLFEISEKVFENNLFLFIGKYSTEIYMSHFILECSIVAFVFLKINNLQVGYFTNVMIALIIEIICVMVVSIVLSKLNQYYKLWINNKINIWIKE